MSRTSKQTVHWSCLISTAFVVFALGASAAEAEQSTSYVLIVANNISLDEGVAPLRYADDDGAKYFELFEAAGAEVKLLSVLDPDAQERFPGAAKMATPPSIQNFLGSVDALFEQIAKDKQDGLSPNFILIYTGHGNVGANREGYINLLDERFTRSRLYSDIIARSPAVFNHIILDACHSYYFVNKRGGQPDKQGDYSQAVQAFLQKEELSSYPNTGVILAASQESETHEWTRWEAGIFSHELVSCLVGAGDVNADGDVTYDEAAACIESANFAIKVKRARLNVYYTPPAQKVDEPLMRLSSLDGAPKMQMPATMADRYHVEDSRGVRALDVNYTSEQPLSLALIGQAPFYVRTSELEAVIDIQTGQVSLDQIQFHPLAAAHKGSVESSFRKHLYEVPFGLGFYNGMRAKKNSAEPAAPIFSMGSSDAPVDQQSSRLRLMGFGALGLGAATALASGFVYLAANSTYQDYKNTDDTETAKGLHDKSENQVLTSRILIGAAVGFAVAGGIMLIVDSKKKKKQADRKASLRPQPFVFTENSGVVMGISGVF